MAIHRASPRSRGPFVVVECSGLTEALFESEMFGHEKGAFTGAYARRIGLVEAATGGTLFLDEVGDIPLPLQVKLLRLLETGAHRRVGSAETKKADFRRVCATHRDLAAMVDAGRFRQDRCYRISTFPIALPALRERREDLSLLVRSLLQRLAPQRSVQVGAGAMALLSSYHYPGNVRELRNILERASLLADDDRILPDHLPGNVVQRQTTEAGTGTTSEGEVTPLDEAERRYLLRVVRLYHGGKNGLVRQLGISERTLYRKLEKLHTE